MNKLFTKLLLIALFALWAVPNANAKVKIGSTEYSTLAQAFAAVNAGTHTGNIVMQITADISETTRAFLNASGVGNASYSSVVIYPTGDYKISGNQATALVELRGADNVTFDGRKDQSGTSNSLTIENTNTGMHTVIWLDSNTAGGGGASNNTIRNINIVAGTITNGYGIVLSVSTSLTGTGAGNDNNTIAYCTFKKALYGIRAYGASTTATVKNLKIHNNYFGSSVESETVTAYGVYGYNTSDLQIYDNVFKDMVYTSAIYVIYDWYGSKSKIYNNTIDNIRSTGSVVYGIQNYYGNENKIYNNSFTNFSASASACYPVYSVSSPYTEFYDNKVENMVSGASVVYGFYMSTGNYTKVNNNTFKNFTAASTIYGVFLSSAQYSEVNNNVFDNHVNPQTNYSIYFSSCQYSKADYNRITNMFLSGTYYGVAILSSPYTTAIGNYIDNVYNSATGNTCGVYGSSSQYAKVNNNIISRIDASMYSYGIYLTTVADAEINGNEIFNITASGSSTTGAMGIYVLGTSSNGQLINNSIANIRSTQWSTASTTTNPFGIVISGGTGYKIWHNSIQLSGKQIATGTQGTLSACLMISSTAVNTINLRNNNFSNTLEGLSGSRSFCVYLSNTSNLTSSTMDYNNYYVGGPFGMVGFVTSNRISLADWKTGTSREANSMNIYTEFNSINNNAPVPGSAIIGKGTPITDVVYDIMGIQRSTTNPTPGAYEKAADILPPDIVFNQLLTTTNTNNPVIVATITDYSGVNKTSSAPRLYYRAQRHTNAWVGNSSSQDGWKYATASINGNQYSFTLDYNKLSGGLVIGDAIEYFIVAQDDSPAKNIGTSKGYFSVKPTTTDLNAQNFPYYDAANYRVAYGIKGDVKVGSSQDYLTLTDAGGLFEYLNKNVVTGDLNILITSDITETGNVILGKLTYEGAPFYNVNIRPSEAKTKKISGAVASKALIGLIGVSNLNLDGSYNGEGRYLEITNTNSSGVYATIAVGSGGLGVNGGKFITIQNCIIYCGYTASTNGSYGILVTDGVFSTSATSPRVNDFTIRNNHIYKSSYGIYARGVSTTGNMFENLLIENNEIGKESTGDGITVRGIDVMWLQSAMIRKNTVHSFATTLATNYAGIEVGGSLSNFVTLDGNRIYNIKQPSASGYGAYGINITGGSSVGYTIMNNFISEISTMNYSNSSNLYNPFGIRVAGGNYHKFWHNTIIMTGQQGTAGSQPSLTANIFFTSTFYYHDFKGNILHNSLQGLSGTRSFNIFVYTTSAVMPTVVTSADYNNYTVGGAAGVYGGYGTAQPFTEATSLTAWKNMTTRDANSFSTATEHVSATDCHLNASSIGNTGIMIPRMAQVMYDGDGELRNSSTYVGADEVVPYLDIVKSNTFNPQNAVYCIGSDVDISFDYDLYFGDGVKRSGLSNIDINWYKNGSLINGQKSKVMTLGQLKMADSAKYYATVKFMNLEVAINERLLTVEAPIVITQQPSNADVCSADPILTLTSAVAGNIYGYQWEFRRKGTSTWMPMAGKTQPSFSMIVEDRNAAIGDYRLKIMGPGNCGSDVVYSDIVNVIVSDPLHNPMLHVDGNLYYTCVGADLVLHATGEGSIYGYRWQRNIGQGFIDISINDNPTAHSHTLRMKGVNPDNSGEYRCMILGSGSCGTAFVPTESTPVRVWPFFVLEEEPENHIVCQNGEVILKVFAEGTIYRYQWMKNGIDIPVSKNLYADQTIFIIPSTQYDHSGVYQCRLYVEDCFGPQVITTKPASVYVTTPTEFTRKPTTQAVMLGNSVNWVVRAHVNGAPPSFQPKVQWFRGTQPILESPKHVGTKSSSLVIANIQDSDYGDDYWVVVYGLCGNDTVRNFGLVKSEFSITSQPTGSSPCQGEFVSFSVSATSSTGEPISYRWHKDGVALLDNADYVGSHSSTLIVNNSRAELNGHYYCEVKVPSSPYGLFSYVAELEVTDKPAITKDLEQIVNLMVGNELMLEVETTGTDLNYQWYYNTEAIPMANEASYSIESVDESDAGEYYVMITNACGEVSSEIAVVSVSTSTSDVTYTMKDGYSLGTAVPNPVNSSSVIAYEVATDGFVEIVLINQLGVEVAELVNTRLAGGEYQLNIDANALRLTSGIYSVVMRANGVQLIQRLAVVK